MIPTVYTLPSGLGTNYVVAPRGCQVYTRLHLSVYARQCLCFSFNSHQHESCNAGPATPGSGGTLHSITAPQWDCIPHHQLEACTVGLGLRMDTTNTKEVAALLLWRRSRQAREKATGWREEAADRARGTSSASP